MIQPKAALVWKTIKPPTSTPVTLKMHTIKPKTKPRMAPSRGPSRMPPTTMGTSVRVMLNKPTFNTPKAESVCRTMTSAAKMASMVNSCVFCLVFILSLLTAALKGCGAVDGFWKGNPSACMCQRRFFALPLRR